jgi:DnaJ-class molecular chaperone
MRVEVCDQCAGRGGVVIADVFEYCFACMGDGYLVYEKDPKTIDKSKES